MIDNRVRVAQGFSKRALREFHLLGQGALAEVESAFLDVSTARLPATSPHWRDEGVAARDEKCDHRAWQRIHRLFWRSNQASRRAMTEEHYFFAIVFERPVDVGHQSNGAMVLGVMDLSLRLHPLKRVVATDYDFGIERLCGSQNGSGKGNENRQLIELACGSLQA